MKLKTYEAWRAEGVWFGEEVNLSRIAPDAKIFPGCRISGERTAVGPGCVLGAEAPATLDDCLLGRNVHLAGGRFSGAVFMDGASMGSGAHVRPGTILEEDASGAHAVGLKQTILLPFVTLGSLVNFCDVLMAGGTGRKDHGEVGSSYVHFNFTPHQDKATASLIGDVPRGTFLDCRPVFLGGQGGLVGPARIAFGCVVAAGGVCRRDVLEEDVLLVPESPRPGIRPYALGAYRRIGRTVRNNLRYIGNVFALRAWYRHVRRRTMRRDAFDEYVVEGGLRNLDAILRERLDRLGALAGKMERSVSLLENAQRPPEEEISVQRGFREAWPGMSMALEETRGEGDEALREDFLGRLDVPGGDVDYVAFVKGMDESTKAAGRAWLGGIVDATLAVGMRDA